MSKKSINDIRVPTYDDLFTNEEQRQEAKLEKIMEIPVEDIQEFKNHPFRVRNDEQMSELVKSVSANGILVPVLVRPHPNSHGYEMISGHRRMNAAMVNGQEKIQAIVRELTDDQATIIMVDSNIQREHILPSEKAHAYAMKYEALKHQGVKGRKNTADMVGEMAGDSSRTVQRYIRLSKLVPGLLKYVDNGELQVASAEQLAGLPEEEQKIVLDVIEYLVIFPNRQLATKIKELSQAGNLKRETLYEIFAQRNETRVNVTIPSKRIKNYFPEEYTKEQMESVIYELLEEWSHKKGIVQ